MLTSSKPIKVDTSIVRKCADDYGYPSPVSPPVRKPGHLEDVILPSRFINEYTVEDEIGFGGFGFVYAVTRKRDGVELACKFIFKEKISRSSWYNDADLGLVPMEVAVLKNVHHENIIEFVDYMDDYRFCYCFTKLHGTGWSESAVAGKRAAMDLFECIEQSDHFTEPMARHIFSQVVEAVAHLHNLGLAHRDIKDENILIDHDFSVKLIDLGSAAFVNPDRPFDLFLGTKQYAAPEILCRNEYCGWAADVWSLGCCLYIILTGAVPFSSGTQAIQYPFTTPNRDVSDSCLNLLRRMLEKDARKRANIEEIRNHPWLTMNFLPVSHL